MKKYLLRTLAFVTCFLPMLSCQENNVTPPTEEPYINIEGATKLEAPYDGKIFDVQVKSNCNWTIAKTDAEGTAIDWVKCDASTGKGDMTLRVRVYPNGTADPRNATVTLSQGDTKAFIDVTQEANPNPEKPEDPNPPVIPSDEEISLFFDFTVEPQPGWPTQDKSTRIHVNGGTPCTYTLDGKDYIFICADCDDASTLDVYWATTGKLHLASQWRYLGLPAIEGYKLTSIVADCIFYTASIQPKIGIVDKILGFKVNPGEEDIVKGGEIVTWENDGEKYEYYLSDTEENTVYYLYAEAKGGVTGLNLVYTKCETTPRPAARTLTFDFTGAPQEGWPTQDKATRIHQDGGTSCVYNLDGEPFTFICADCNGASTLDVYWATTGKFHMASQWRYFGLPILEGLKLTKIRVECLYYTASIQPKIGVVKRILDLKVDPAEGDFVGGGEIQTWDTDKTWYTYDLTDTEDDTLYFMYCEAKGGWTTLELTYE